jgi:hypothetical protein
MAPLRNEISNMTPKKKISRVALLLFVCGLALATAGCEATVGVGVSYGYPGPWHGAWGGPVYMGGPIYP